MHSVQRMLALNVGAPARAASLALKPAKVDRCAHMCGECDGASAHCGEVWAALCQQNTSMLLVRGPGRPAFWATVLLQRSEALTHAWARIAV